jgi:polyribonucleotide 5'-hydroxyl-kinase
MDLPGLGFEPAGGPLTDEQPASTNELVANSEWRFEVAYGSSIEVKVNQLCILRTVSTTNAVQLIKGTAELFGTELAPNQPYIFSGSKAAIFTYHGCTLSVTGSPSSDYVAEETPMTSYANLHFALEPLRDAAASSSGPRIMLVGPDDSGKTCLTKLLAAYASRSHRRPVVVNLNPSEGMLTMPGAISAVAFESILDVEEGWGSSPLTGPSPVPVKLPLVYFYGSTDPFSASERYKVLTTRLALAVRHHLDEDTAARQTGVIVDTAGSVAGSAAARGNYELIRTAVTEFQISVIAVLGSERLFSGLSKHYPQTTHNGHAHPDVTLLRLEKSGGCVERDASYREQTRASEARSYFFGRQTSSSTPGATAPPLAPHTVTVPFTELTIYKPHDPADLVPLGLMPGGVDDDGGGGGGGGGGSAANRGGTLKLLDRVDPPFSPDMQGTLLAVLQVEATASVETVAEASVLGFLYVVEVDVERARLKVLSPMGGRVPRNAILWGPGVDVGPSLMG